MPSENLNKLKQELLVAHSVLLPQIEGLEDFNRLNIKPETKAKVTETLGAFVRRRDLIQVTVDALAKLEGDSFPDMPDISVDQAVYADLKANVDTIAAAFDKFDAEMATSLGVKIGAPEEK